MSTLSSLRRFILRHELLPAGAGIVVGVSGGPDSLALLHALHRLAPEFDWRLHAAYLHHGLRAEADEEARFVAEVAAAWGLGCTVERADVRRLAAQPCVSIEEAARQSRYAFLGGVALRIGAGFVAVGHNADDQAETMLMHLLRGSGLAGLRGMQPSTLLADLRLPILAPAERPNTGDVRLVRPWLETPRRHILAYCQAHGLQPRIDASNTDTTFFRNRLRHEILPHLIHINPQLTETLGRTAAALQGDYEALTQHRQALWQELAEPARGRVRIDLPEFRRLPRGDQRAMLRRAIGLLRPDLRNINWAHTEGLLDLLAVDPARASGGPFPLVAGVEAWLNYDALELTTAALPVDEHPQIAGPVELALPGRLALANGWELRAAPVHGAFVADPGCIRLPIDIAQPLTVRPRQPGDRMQPFGLAGTKPITDLMTELKLPRPARPGWPLLVAGDGEILWLVGQRPAERCRVSDDGSSAWEVRLARVMAA